MVNVTVVFAVAMYKALKLPLEGTVTAVGIVVKGITGLFGLSITKV